MPASTPRWSSRRPAPGIGPRRVLRSDDAGVSEVVGFLLTFAILSILLVGSMIAFNVAQERAEERTVGLQMESVAARVAGLIVQTSLLAEQQGASTALAYTVDLPPELEGRAYEVRVEAAGRPTGCDPDDDSVAETGETAAADQVCVVVKGLDLGSEAPLFSAAAPTNVKICSTNVGGGEILVRYDVPGSATPPVICTPALPVGVTKGIFLQAS